MKIVSTKKTPETAYLEHTECRSSGSRQLLCASGSVNNSIGGTVKLNAPDVPVVMPEYADGSSELKETEDTAEVELDSG